MAHESFEDPATADVMNRLFVNVKVDREERPDVDAIYMQAVQALTGRGGWPMSVWLTPDGRPFYGGTYFPDDDRHGMPSFAQVCEVVAEAWNEQRDDVEEQADKLTERDRRAGAAAARRRRPRSTPRSSRRAYGKVRAQFDPQWGGFGRAPKFPQAMTIDFLCRALVRNRRARDARDDHDHARRDGRGRHPRPARRRLRPLLDRRLLARPPLREDALRQRAAHPRVPARLPRHRRGRATARSSRTSSATCCATSPIRPAASTPRRTPTPKASRASSTAGRSPRSARCAAPTPTR